MNLYGLTTQFCLALGGSLEFICRSLMVLLVWGYLAFFRVLVGAFSLHWPQCCFDGWRCLLLFEPFVLVPNQYLFSGAFNHVLWSYLASSSEFRSYFLISFQPSQVSCFCLSMHLCGIFFSFNSKAFQHWCYSLPRASIWSFASIHPWNILYIGTYPLNILYMGTVYLSRPCSQDSFLRFNGLFIFP